MTDEYVQAISVGDLEAMMNLMDDNFVMIPPNESVRRWEEAIREWYKSGFDRFHYKNAAYPTDEIKVFWDWSMKRGNFKATLEPKMGGNSIHIHIKAIHMLTKQSDGSWRISHAIWNNNPTAD